jgi:hypothetical protein
MDLNDVPRRLRPLTFWMWGAMMGIAVLVAIVVGMGWMK